MKKIFSMLLTAVMVFSMSATAFAADFKDTVNIPQSEAIDVIETLGIVNGYGNDVFGPNDTLTRAQLCTMLTRALYGDPIYTSTNQFKDVAPTHWANAYINTAYAYGLMAGYGGGYFGPEDEITYTQMAAVIMKALGYDCGKMSWPTGVNSMGHTLGLFDNVKLADYATGCTRAHAAQMIYNAFDLNYVNHKADYPVSIKNKTFLKDGLGFEETVDVIDGHQFVAYIDLDDGEVYTTDNCLTYEATIYPTIGLNEYCSTHAKDMRDHTATENCKYESYADGYGYHFKNSNKSYNIDWYWMDGDNTDGIVLYVNGSEISQNSEIIFDNCKSATGVFDEDDKLLAIYIDSVGKDYVYSVSADTAYIDTIVKDNDMPKNTEDMTVTYFEETGKYVISTKVDYGWVTGAYKSAIYIDGVKFEYDNNPAVFEKDDFVKIYYNYRGEVSAIIEVSNPYVYDMTDGVYHTSECEVWNEYTDHDYHISIDLIKACQDDCCKDKDEFDFEACTHCHAKTTPAHNGKDFTIVVK